jgi:hypothetical protein
MRIFHPYFTQCLDWCGRLCPSLCILKFASVVILHFKDTSFIKLTLLLPGLVSSSSKWEPCCGWLSVSLSILVSRAPLGVHRPDFSACLDSWSLQCLSQCSTWPGAGLYLNNSLSYSSSLCSFPQLQFRLCVVILKWYNHTHRQTDTRRVQCFSQSRRCTA